MKKHFLLGIILLTSLSLVFASKSKQAEKLVYVQRDLTEQNIVNLNAVNKLYGYSRYFYPNQEAGKFSETDWYKFLVYAIEKTIDSKSKAELQNSLETVFKPLVPELIFEKSYSSTNKTNDTPFFYWEHMGIGKFPAKTNKYINKINKSEKASPQLPTPDSLYSLALSDDITAYMPLSTSNRFNKNSKDWKRLKKSIKKRSIKVADRGFFKMLFSKDEAQVVTLLDDKIRYADLMVKWNVIKHFYPYYKEDKLDGIWEESLNNAFVESSQLNHYMEYVGITKRFMANVNDSHIDIQENITFDPLIHKYIQSFVTPLKFDWCENNKIYISVSDSLVNKGDQVISINGIDIKELIKTKSKYISASSNQGKMEKIVNKELLISHTEDTIYNIKLQDTNDNVKLIEVKPTIPTFWLIGGNTDSTFVENLGDNIYYLNLLSSNEENSYEAFKKLIPELQDAKGIIIDIRGYPNPHITDNIVAHFSKDSVVTGQFLQPYYYFPNQENVILKNEGNGYLDKVAHSDLISTPLCVLINHKAMSFGETAIDMFQNSTNATLVGSPTVGTNGDMTLIDIPLFKFMMTAIYEPNSHGIGISPDILAYPTLQDIRMNKDVVLDTAKRHLLELK